MLTEKHLIGASRYVQALRDSAIDHVVTVPDWVQWALHKSLEEGEDGLRSITCCTEEQAVALAAGLTISGRRPIVLVQNQGFYACINAIRAIALDARIPTAFLIGQFGREAANVGEDPAQSGRNMVRLLEPVLDTLGIEHHRIDTAEDLQKLPEATNRAFVGQRPVAFVVGAPIAWE